MRLADVPVRWIVLIVVVVLLVWGVQRAMRHGEAQGRQYVQCVEANVSTCDGP